MLLFKKKNTYFGIQCQYLETQPHDFIFIYSFLSANHGSICSVHLPIYSHICNMRLAAHIAYRVTGKYQPQVSLYGEGDKVKEKVRDKSRKERKWFTGGRMVESEKFLES